LAKHQSEDGRWDSDGFMERDPAGDQCDGAGHKTHDIGVTGLALLAFLGDGHTTAVGRHKEAVAKGLKWLREQQDPETGLFGASVSHDFMYDHSIATFAVCEAYRLTESPLLERNARMGAEFLQRARNPYNVWRYDIPPTGDNDTSVTGWCVRALLSAREAKLPVDDAAFVATLSWLDQVSDPATGRAGYDSFASMSSRTPANEHYPRESGEAMTAVALLCRLSLGQDPAKIEIMQKHADLLKRKPPEWDPKAFGCDMYYWYYGSHAMARMGTAHRKRWESAMLPAVIDSQRTDGSARGSWDPIGPWGYSGGRIYSTALMAMALGAGPGRPG